MFSGIVEAQSKILKMQKDANADQKAVRIFVVRPASFDDLKNGDSICVNGICLTIEKFNSDEIQFCLGAETLSIIGENLALWSESKLNLERSLKFGDRVHGHLVTGHVDSLGRIVETYQDGECWQIQFQVADHAKKSFWNKGSVCLNGVSLTVNEVKDDIISVCLIPETIQNTNLSTFKVGQFLNVEADYLAKAFFQFKANNQDA